MKTFVKPFACECVKINCVHGAFQGYNGGAGAPGPQGHEGERVSRKLVSHTLCEAVVRMYMRSKPITVKIQKTGFQT